MGDSIRFKRGTTPQRLSYTPAVGEPVIDTDTDTVFIGDGSKLGGHKVGGAGDLTDYTLYAVTAALGGTSTGTGRQLESGVTTATTANKLVNGNASFTTALVGKTVYNTTDGTWAKITARDSATQLSISADIMATGEAYVICDAVTTLAEAYALPDTPYKANITLRFSPGTFAGDATLIGKIAGENKTITIQGDNLAAGGGTTLSGNITIYDSVIMQGGANYDLKFTGTLIIKGSPIVTMDYFECQGVVTIQGGSIVAGNHGEFKKNLITKESVNCSWTNTVTTSPAKLYKYDNAINSFNTCTITYGNDPGAYTAISSTITKGYTMYVAPAYGGSDSTGDGLQLYAGSATSTTANKLVDSAANFGTDVVNKTVYNSTDDTWAQVTARDSATQLSLSADIMASGEAYVISKAFATVQKVVDMIPGEVNCDTTAKLSGETFTEKVTIQGKRVSGNYTIKLLGTVTRNYSSTATGGAAGSGATQGTVTVTSGLGVDTYKNKFVKLTSGAYSGTIRIIDSHTDTTMTIVGTWPGAIANGTTFDIVSPATKITWANADQTQNPLAIKGAQTNILGEFLEINRGNVGAYHGWNLYVEAFSQANFNYCLFSGSGNSIYYTGTQGLLIVCVHTEIDAAVGYQFRLVGGSVTSQYSKFQAGTGSGVLVQVNDLSRWQALYGTIIDGASIANVTGCNIDRLSVGVFTSAGTIYQRVRNCTTGINAATGGQGTGTANNQYTGNTTNENAVAASYGYID